MPSKIVVFFKLLLRALLIALLLVGICTYVCFCPPVLTNGNNGAFILFPLPPGGEYVAESVNNVKREEVFFPNDQGNKLHSWFFQSPDKDAPVILFSHGNAGNIGHRLMLAKWLMDAGASVFLFDYREYGKSEGKKNLHGTVLDCKAAYDYLVNERKINPARIVLYGESIGGGPACVLSTMVPSGGLILDSSFTSLLRIARKKVRYFCLYPDFLKPNPAFENITVLAGKHPPLLIVHGQKDEVIPYEEAQDNFAAASEPKQLLLLPASTHNWKDPDSGLYIEGVHKFLEQIKAKAAS